MSLNKFRRSNSKSWNELTHFPFDNAALFSVALLSLVSSLAILFFKIPFTAPVFFEMHLVISAFASPSFPSSTLNLTLLAFVAMPEAADFSLSDQFMVGSLS